jgi:predicted SprT family Zn-dependent metalloprotease
MNANTLNATIQAEAAKIWVRYTKLYRGLARFDQPTIKLNGRLTKTAGRCFMEANYIDLGTKFMLAHYDRMLGEIMVHEIAHQVDYNLNGIPAGNRWHGPTWQSIMRAYGVEPSTYHDMEL